MAFRFSHKGSKGLVGVPTSKQEPPQNSSRRWTWVCLGLLIDDFLAAGCALFGPFSCVSLAPSFPRPVWIHATGQARQACESIPEGLDQRRFWGQAVLWKCGDLTGCWRGGTPGTRWSTCTLCRYRYLPTSACFCATLGTQDSKCSLVPKDGDDVRPKLRKAFRIGAWP